MFIKYSSLSIPIVTTILTASIASVYAQPTEVVLKDTTITATSAFAATKSITAGSNFTVASSGDVAFVSGNFVTFKPLFTVIEGGKLKVLTGATISDVATEGSPLPTEFIVHQNYPNPFNPTTKIRYELPSNEKIRIVVYDIFGRRIKTLISQYQQAGYYFVDWDARDDIGQKVSSGVYLVMVAAAETFIIKKMILVQ